MYDIWFKKSIIMTSEDNKKFMNCFIEEVINNKNLDAANDLVAEDFIEEIPFPGQEPGREGLKFALQAMFDGFPDMNWTVLEQIAEGEKVVTRFVWTGTHEGNFMGIPALIKLLRLGGSY